MNLVTLARVQRNPTVKNEIQQKGYGQTVTAGFVNYPINQAADITAFQATVVPVGQDQLPMIEQTNEIVRSFNRIYKTDVLVEAEALITKTARLSGIDGQAKMSKSLGNAIFLKDSADELAQKVRAMYTDPTHIRVEDPGKLEGNTVFEYLDIFGTDKQKVQELKDHYQKGGLGDSKVKQYLLEQLNAFLEPIRTRRQKYTKDTAYLREILLKGTGHAHETSQNVLTQVKQAMHLVY